MRCLSGLTAVFAVGGVLLPLPGSPGNARADEASAAPADTVDLQKSDPETSKFFARALGFLLGAALIPRDPCEPLPLPYPFLRPGRRPSWIAPDGRRVYIDFFFRRNSRLASVRVGVSLETQEGFAVAETTLIPNRRLQNGQYIPSAHGRTITSFPFPEPISLESETGDHGWVRLDAEGYVVELELDVMLPGGEGPEAFSIVWNEPPGNVAPSSEIERLKKEAREFRARGEGGSWSTRIWGVEAPDTVSSAAEATGG